MVSRKERRHSASSCDSRTVSVLLICFKCNTPNTRLGRSFQAAVLQRFRHTY
jgi:hypothetical protein